MATPLALSKGGVRVSELQRFCQEQQGCSAVPRVPGIYLNVRRSAYPVRFSKVSHGGLFKQSNPTLS
jgi:hypothetical protein